MTLEQLYLIVTIALAFWTYFDARRLDDEGFDSWLSPFPAAFLVLVLAPFCLPAYLANRSATLRAGPAGDYELDAETE